jgi:hypothetical protein
MPDVLLAYMPPRTLPQVEEFELHKIINYKCLKETHELKENTCFPELVYYLRNCLEEHSWPDRV